MIQGIQWNNNWAQKHACIFLAGMPFAAVLIIIQEWWSCNIIPALIVCILCNPLLHPGIKTYYTSLIKIFIFLKASQSLCISPFISGVIGEAVTHCLFCGHVCHQFSHTGAKHPCVCKQQLRGTHLHQAYWGKPLSSEYLLLPQHYQFLEDRWKPQLIQHGYLLLGGDSLVGSTRIAGVQRLA